MTLQRSELRCISPVRRVSEMNWRTALLHSDRRGWIIVAGLSLVSFVTLGVSMPTIGIFLDPFSREFGWNGAQSARIATAFMLAFQLSGPAVGWWLTRVPVKTVMTTGVALVVAGYAWASAAHTLPEMTLAMATAGLGVSASTYIPCTVLATRWIREEHRGLAIGLIIGASSLGGAVFVPAIQLLIEAEGWRMAKQIIAVQACVIALPIVLFVVREQPATAIVDKVNGSTEGRDLNLAKALRAPSYLWLVIMVIMTNIALMGVVFHIVPFLRSFGFASGTAAALYAGTNISSFFGYIIVGIVADRIGAHRTLLVSFALNAFSIFVLLFAGPHSTGFAAALVFVVIWGGTVGAWGQLLPILLLESLGRRLLGALLGFAGLAYGLLGGIGPITTGALHDATGGYALAFELCAVLTLTAIIPSILARRAKVQTMLV